MRHTQVESWRQLHRVERDGAGGADGVEKLQASKKEELLTLFLLLEPGLVSVVFNMLLLSRFWIVTMYLTEVADSSSKTPSELFFHCFHLLRFDPSVPY